MFSVVNGVLLRPLPYHEPERLINIWNDIGEGPRPQSPPAVSANHWRSMQLLNATALPNAPMLDEHSPGPHATALYGIGSWLAWGLEAGSVAQVGILHLADFDPENALVVQRDVETGALNLRPLAKPILYP